MSVHNCPTWPCSICGPQPLPQSTGGGSGQGPSGVADADLVALADQVKREVERAFDLAAGFGKQDNETANARREDQLANARRLIDIHQTIAELIASTATGQQEAIADPPPLDPSIAVGDQDHTWLPDPPKSAHVPHTEGEKACPDCEGHGETNEGPDGVDDDGNTLYAHITCPSCSGTGKGNK